MNALALIVEDDAEVAEILEAYLIREGLRTARATDGATAIELHGRLKPDIVLLDIKMPKANGYQVLAAIRQRDETPVIMVTALDEDLDKLQALRIGADDYVVKPFNPLEVVARVKAVLRRTLGGNDYLNGGAGNDYMYGGLDNDTYEIGGSGSGGAGGLTGGWDKFIELPGEGTDRILIQDTAGWAWTAIQINGFGPVPGIANIEIIENNSTGPGYVYVQGTVDFGDVTQWIGSFSGIYGTANADTIRGSDQADPTIEGRAGNDVIDGRGGDDRIDGGAGYNTITGGSGNDTFVVSSAGDYSTITDFVRGEDIIEFNSSIADDFSDLTITDVSGDAYVTVGSVGITLAGVDHTLLDASDFLFV